MQKIYLVLANRQQKAPVGLAPVWEQLFLAQYGLSITVIQHITPSGTSLTRYRCIKPDTYSGCYKWKYIYLIFFLRGGADYLSLKWAAAHFLRCAAHNENDMSYLVAFWLWEWKKSAWWHPDRFELFRTPLIGRCFWTVEIPHSCRLAVASHVILLSENTRNFSSFQTPANRADTMKM